MACQGCAERRAKIKKMFGFGLGGAEAGQPTGVAEVDAPLTAIEFSAPPNVKELLVNYISDSDGYSSNDICMAAAHLIVIAIAKSCPDAECANKYIDSFCFLMHGRIEQRTDQRSGKWREIIPVTGKFGS